MSYLGLQAVHILVFVPRIVLDDTVVTLGPTVSITRVVPGPDTADMSVVAPLRDLVMVDEAERPHDGRVPDGPPHVHLGPAAVPGEELLRPLPAHHLLQRGEGGRRVTVEVGYRARGKPGLGAAELLVGALLAALLLAEPERYGHDQARPACDLLYDALALLEVHVLDEGLAIFGLVQELLGGHHGGDVHELVTVAVQSRLCWELSAWIRWLSMSCGRLKG